MVDAGHIYTVDKAAIEADYASGRVIQVRDELGRHWLYDMSKGNPPPPQFTIVPKEEYIR